MIESPIKSHLVSQNRNYRKHYKRISRKLVTNFTRDLSIMLNSGLLLVDSINILIQQTTHEPFRQILQDIGKKLKSGANFADCLKSYPTIFNTFYIHMVDVGELTGKLDQMLQRVAVYLDKMANTKRKLIQALTYPTLVIGVALFSLVFIMIYVIPIFADVFKEFGAELPWQTLLLISISNFIYAHALYILVGFMVGIFVLKYIKSFQKVRIFFDNFTLNIPLVGEIIRKNYISQFCRTLGTLLESGIPLLQGLDISIRAIQNHLIQQDILKMKSFAMQGEKLTYSLKHSKIFPLMVIQMIAVGEETAELPSMLIRISDFYDREIDSTIETLASIIEPIVIIVLGIIIGAILISIYLPLFNLSNAMTG
ncbi:MAG: type II secretion system F family protein [Ignavibacteria bacterium]|nr:MAG: type II secretion system F family protein [Ignavibacteria bacterium]